MRSAPNVFGMLKGAKVAIVGRGIENHRAEQDSRKDVNQFKGERKGTQMPFTY